MQTPVFTLFYEDKNITKDVSPYVLSVEYTDFEHGESEQYGYIFKITEDSLVFYKVSALKSAKSTLILYKSDLSRINLAEKTSKQYKSVQISYFNPKKKKRLKPPSATIMFKRAIH